MLDKLTNLITPYFERWPDTIQTLLALVMAWLIATLIHVILMRLLRHNRRLNRYEKVAGKVANRIARPTRISLLLSFLDLIQQFAFKSFFSTIKQCNFAHR